MLSDEQWQKIADKTGCFITGGLKEAIEVEVRKQDTVLIRQLVEALEHHIFLTRPKDFLGCELSNDTAQCCTARSYSRGSPCNMQPLIFVNKEKYFAYKLLGTIESSD